MNQLGGFPLLTLIVFLPGLSALIIALIPAEKKQIWRWLAFLIAATNLFVSLFLYMGWVDDSEGRMQFVDGPLDWIPSLGIQYHLGIDGISIHLVMLTTFVTPLVLLLIWQQSSRAQAVWILLFQVGVLGALVALNLVMFFTFWLLARLVTFLMLAHDASPTTPPHAAQTGIPFQITTGVAAILITVVIAGLLTQRHTLDLSGLIEAPLGWKSQAWMFWCIAVAMGITSGAFPPFSLVDLGEGVSPATHILTNSLLVNLGGYGLIRFAMSIFPLAATRFAPPMIVLGLAGLLYGAVAAAACSSVGRALGYWTMAQTGLATIALFSMQNLGVHGATMSFLCRGLGSAALLILSGSKAERGHATPASSALAYLSLIGVPGLAGFVGTSAMVMGLSHLRWQAGISPGLDLLLDWGTIGAVALGLFIGTWALFRMWQRMDQETSAASVHFLPVQRIWIALPVLIALVVIGLHPLPFSDMVGPSVYRFLGDVENGAQKSLLEMQAGQLEQEQLLPTNKSSLPQEKASLLRREIETKRLPSASTDQVSTRCPCLSAAPF